MYQLQAAVAAVHDEAARSEDTDWPQILALYELLKRVPPGPIVTLNHAIAAAMVYGPSKGLELLRTLDTDARLSRHYRLDAVRAHLLEMAGDLEGAVKHYRIAADRTTSIPEQNYLMTQASRLDDTKVRSKGTRSCAYHVLEGLVEGRLRAATYAESNIVKLGVRRSRCL